MGMMGPNAVSCWGIAPGKKSVQPEVLGFGFAKFVVSGFTSLVMFNAPKMLEVVGKIPQFISQIGFTQPPFTLPVLQNIIKALTAEHVESFVELMGDGIAKYTVGAGDRVVCPQGRQTKVL